jgi:hypothetical protein
MQSHLQFSWGLLRYIVNALTISALISILACSKAGKSGSVRSAVTNLRVSPTQATLTAAQQQDFTISGGIAPYRSEVLFGLVRKS